MVKWTDESVSELVLWGLLLRLLLGGFDPHVETLRELELHWVMGVWAVLSELCGCLEAAAWPSLHLDLLALLLHWTHDSLIDLPVVNLVVSTTFVIDEPFLDLIVESSLDFLELLGLLLLPLFILPLLMSLVDMLHYELGELFV